MSIGAFSQKINSTDIKDFFFGGWAGMAKHISDKKWNTSLVDAAYEGFKADSPNEMLSVKIGGRNWSGKKIAGGLAGIGIGSRFASGGGAYRDKNGDTDIAGIPFI